MNSETKIFYKTSEFWLVVFTNVLAIVAQMAGSLPAKYAVPLQAFINAGYALSRGLAKSGVPPTPGA